MKTGFHHQRPTKRENDEVLKAGTPLFGKPKQYSYDGFAATKPKGEVLDALAQMDNTLMKIPDISVDLIEVYNNGAINVYILLKGEPYGFFTIRP